MEWTPTEIMQPPKSGKYLVTGREYFIPDHINGRGYKDGVIKFAYYDSERGWSESRITAWMSLPKPYKKPRKAEVSEE